jgi:hypothetical protein
MRKKIEMKPSTLAGQAHSKIGIAIEFPPLEKLSFTD